MFNVIGKLQRKPFYVRRRIALFVSGVIVFIIAALWAATLNLRANVTIPTPANSVIKIEENGNTVAPFTLFKNQLDDIRATFLNKPEF